jgi:hypothetical protein
MAYYFVQGQNRLRCQLVLDVIVIGYHLVLLCCFFQFKSPARMMILSSEMLGKFSSDLRSSSQISMPVLGGL